MDFIVEPSARPGFGDVSCNVAFLVAKTAHRAPRDIAIEIAGVCKTDTLIEHVEAHNSGHINFFANIGALNESVITSTLRTPCCAIDVGHNIQVTIEHTSVNPNKALHIGHMRNVVLGDVISRILANTNHRVRVLNYIDDLGLQVAHLVMGFTQFGFSESAPEGKKFDHYCGDDVYVDVMKKIKEKPELKDDAGKILEAMEDDATAEAKIANRVSRKILGAQLDTCWRIGVTYDCLNFESHIIHSGMWDDIFAKLKASSIIKLETQGDNAGCWIVPGSGDSDDKVLVRSNGTATYIAKDIPYAAWKLGKMPDPFKYESYAIAQPGHKLLQTALDGHGDDAPAFVPDRVITVIDSRQTRLQTIITQLLEKFFDVSKDDYLHLAYESVTLSAQTAEQLGMQTDGRNVQMSGRSGLYVNADSVLDTLQERARTETAKRNPEMSDDELDKISKQIAVGVIRYEMIRQDLDKIITFDLNRSLRLDGDTSSYLQYSHARASRILEKIGESTATPDYAALCGAHERELVRTIGTMGIAIHDAATNLSPKVIARHSHELTVAFNAFYEHVRVIGSDEAESVSAARVALVKSFKTVLEYELGLLGIPLPSKM